MRFKLRSSVLALTILGLGVMYFYPVLPSLAVVREYAGVLHERDIALTGTLSAEGVPEVDWNASLKLALRGIVWVNCVKLRQARGTAAWS